MSSKRPLDLPEDSNDAKRIRSNNGSPAPAPQNGETELERKKREAAEKMAAVRARLAAAKPAATATATPSPPPAPAKIARPPPPPPPASNDVEAKRAEAQRKIAEMKARMMAKRKEAAPAQPSEREQRIAEARRRAQELSKQQPAPSTTTAAPTAPPPPPRQDGRGARGGLGVGLHPSLLSDNTAPATGKATSKFAGSRAANKTSTKANPYLSTPDEEAGQQHDAEIYDPAIASRRGGERKAKQLHFNEKGKFIDEANKLRQQVRMEEMRRQIAAETRKTAIEEAGDKAFLVPAPPAVEWWDEGLLPDDQKTYEDCLLNGRNKIEDTNVITALVQHPVPIEAPQDKFIPAPKPLPLTQQETKKLRRMRRKEAQKEEQAKVRLGVLPAPAPKVKKSNMMRVYGEQAVQDPTAVEARVNKEIAARANEHVRANEERKLTKEEREAKLKRQREGDEAKGVRVCVFRVDDLSNGQARYKIDVNAKQNEITGIVVLHPTMNLIIVEGGAHSINFYKKLMLNRIKWSENTEPLSANPNTTFTGSSAPRAANPNTDGPQSKQATWCSPHDESGNLKDLSRNRCVLVWEGEEEQRRFKKWGSRVAETDGEARDILAGGGGRVGMENMWTLARGM